MQPSETDFRPSLNLVDQPTTLLSTFCRHATRTPDADFLVERSNAPLSYAQAHGLVTQLLPRKLRSLTDSTSQRVKPGPPSFAILSTNTSLVPLIVMACWFIPTKVAMLSANADPLIWASMVKVTGTDIVLAEPAFIDALSDVLGTTPRIPILDITSVIPAEFSKDQSDPGEQGHLAALVRWLRHGLSTHHISKLPSQISSASDAVTLFTSSAIDQNTVKCVSYSHKILAVSSERIVVMLGGAQYLSKPQRHLGWLPLSHCFEFCIVFW